MKKLNLNKQIVSLLSIEEMSDVNGGGRFWSHINNGDCNYSDANPIYEDNDGTVPVVRDCAARGYAIFGK